MIHMYKLKLTNLQQEILRLLFVKAGSFFNQRQIANFLEVSPPAVMKALPRMEKEKLISIFQDKETKRWSIKLNRDNYKIMQLKRVDNLRLMYETGLADFLEEECAGASIILFGSYSRGEDIFSSDIDIAVIGRKSKQIDLKKYEKEFERQIHVQFYNSFNLIHKNLRENILSGIILVGGVEL